jgi:hypothetical protein
LYRVCQYFLVTTSIIANIDSNAITENISWPA